MYREPRGAREVNPQNDGRRHSVGVKVKEWKGAWWVFVDHQGRRKAKRAGPGSRGRALLAAARRIDPDFAALLQVWAQSGMRAGEVCGLQWQDVDLEAGTAIVQRTWSRHRLGPPKTGPARKVSFLHPVPDDTPAWRPGSTAEARSAVTALRRLTIRSMDPEAFVFGRGRTPRSSMDLHRSWRRVMAVAKVRYRAPEQLRHTFASTMLSRNAPLLYVQAQGGWRSASVLLRVYARWMPHEFNGPLAVPQPAALSQPAATPAQPKPATAVAAGQVNRA